MSQLLTNVLAVVALLGALAFVVAYFVAVFRRDSDEALRKTNADLIVRVELLEKDNDAKTDLIKSQQSQISMLQDMVTGTSAIADLRKDLLAFFEKHEAHAHERHLLMLEGQDRVAEAIGKFTAAVVMTEARAWEKT